MATNVGGVYFDLALESAAFRREMTAARRHLATQTAQMRRSMQQVERAGRTLERQFSQLRAGAVALAGALAVRQFTSFARGALQAGTAAVDTGPRSG